MIEHSTYQNSGGQIFNHHYTQKDNKWVVNPKLKQLGGIRPSLVPPKPLPPPNILYCEWCGILKNGKHTRWMCRFLNWIDNKWK